MSEPVISLREVSKSYVKYDDQPMLVNALRMRTRSRRSALLALDNVNLDVAPEPATLAAIGGLGGLLLRRRPRG